MAPKRAAMGDVSNARANRTALDDFTNQPNNKSQPESKKAALLQPAQRPLSVISGPNDPQPLLSIKPASEKNLGESRLPSVRQVISKRATTIFKDYTTTDVQNVNTVNSGLPSTTVSTASGKQALQSGSQKPAPAAFAAQAKSKTSGSKSSEAYNDPTTIRESALRAISAMISESKAPPRQTESASVSASHPEVVNTSRNSFAGEVKIEQKKTVNSKPVSKADFISMPSNKHVPIAGIADPISSNETRQGIDPKPDLYEQVSDQVGLDIPWKFEEDEEDDYYYDGDDGYVTARSFRGPNDITTNLTTTIIPRKDSKARYEVEAAGAVVAILKPSTELEDEAWDVTMVSEYREEIFEYYRELEVGGHYQLIDPTNYR